MQGTGSLPVLLPSLPAIASSGGRTGINTGFTWHVMNISYIKKKETYNLMGVPLDFPPTDYFYPFTKNAGIGKTCKLSELSGSKLDGLLPKSLFALSKAFFDKSKACYRLF